MVSYVAGRSVNCVTMLKTLCQDLLNQTYKYPMIEHFYLGIYLTRMCAYVQVCMLSHSVMSDPLPPQGLQPARFLCPGGSSGKNTGLGFHAFHQGIFPTQGLNPGLLHCRWILYYLSHQGRPRILEWVALCLLQGIFLTEESNWGLLNCRWILY